MWIMFNLWLLQAGHLIYIESFDTLEVCQDAEHILEDDYQRPDIKFYCVPVQVEKV